jgi:hypothetical protein
VKLRRSLGRLAAVVVATLPAHAAGGTFLDGNELLPLCQSAKPGDYTQCVGFVEAVADVLDTGEINGWRACIPARASADQVKDVAVRFIRERPELQHNRAIDLVAKALSEAFPCKP